MATKKIENKSKVVMFKEKCDKVKELIKNKKLSLRGMITISVSIGMLVGICIGKFCRRR